MSAISSADDEALRVAVRAEIAAAFDGRFPDGVTLEVSDRRVTVRGCVEDVDTAQRVEKAAAVSPGVLGVHNALSTRQPPAPPAPEPQGQPEGSGRHADPADKPAGQVNHKV
ncbi:BON domain-containing protein [Cupriavidus alkaliphilus]|uniref:BON domain-containing protein n=1 Tax=Cupriavidus alkaliphilus TaxID=942866 RepID=UPI000815C824|nr:BON domain-containing protein [Cupriavidus alkaliphilus]SCB26885.1 BON domain-containing protein [Cupriavidus alkaliphilus]